MQLMIKRNVLSLLLFGGGIVFIAYAGWNMLESRLDTAKSLKEAKELVQSPEKGTLQKDAPLKPDFGDTVGLLAIPKLEAELPIVEGTDPDDLEKGVGHYKGSYFPGEDGQIILSGHRDTVFRKLGELKTGDIFEIQLQKGSFKYEITGHKIVDADDTSVVTLQKEKEELIVSTCYPFRYVGNAPQRYVLYAKPI